MGDPGLIPGLGRSPGEKNDNPLWFAWRIPWREAWWVTVHGVEKKHDGLANTFTSFWRRQWHPTPVLLPGKSHGRRSLVGCSPCGRKESDMIERIHFSFGTQGRSRRLKKAYFLQIRNQGHGKDLYPQGSARFHKDWQFFFFFLPVWLTNGIGHFFQLQSCLITKQLDNDLNAAVKNCWLTEAMADNPAKSVWHMWGAATFSCNPMLHSDSCSHCPFFFPPASLCLQLLYNARHLC